MATFHEPYAKWLLATAPWTRGQIEYLFIGNAAIYFVLDRVCERGRRRRFTGGPRLPLRLRGHVMTSLFLLGLNANSHVEQRVFDWLLPAVACVFVF